MLSAKWRPFFLGLNVLNLNTNMDKYLHAVIKCGMKLLIHPQTSMAAPLKFGMDK